MTARMVGYWLLAIGYWLLAIGYWLLEINANNEIPGAYCFAKSP
jgi:hypothetical protein